MKENSQINLKQNHKASNYLSKFKKLKKRATRKSKNLFNKVSLLTANKVIKPNITNDIDNKQIKKERNPVILILLDCLHNLI